MNLSGSINNFAAFDSIAVHGAVSNDHASALAQMQFGRMFDAIEEDVIESSTQELVRHLSMAHFPQKQEFNSASSFGTQMLLSLHTQILVKINL